MRLTERELIIRDKVSNDPTDPDIYCQLQEMAFMFLRRKKVGDCRKDVEDISYLIAGDMFLSISQGIKINYYLGYLEKVYKDYLRDFYTHSKDELPIDPSIDVNHELLGNPSTYDYVEARNKIYLEDIGKVIDQVMENCKYSSLTLSFINLKVSLILTILNDKPTAFHLSPEEEFYLGLLVTKFYEEVKVNGFDVESSLTIKESRKV